MTTPREREARRAKAEARKARRAENARFQAEAVGLVKGLPAHGEGPPVDFPAKRASWPNRTLVRSKAGKRKKKKSARHLAFKRLVAACKAFVFSRNAARNDGMCEIAIPCGGAQVANTWYHGWPQKGGNGLKYDVRSHFASCGDCNMGEYGARYRGSKVYENRHRELLGAALFDELAALHGRRHIKTYEAREMAEALEARTAAGEWGFQ